MGSSRNFDLYDYLIFAATLLISVVIGLYHAFRKGGQKTTKEFLLGDREMPIIPSALSLLVSFQSGILILGISSEMYVKGITYAWYVIGICVGLPLAAFVYQPVFYELKLVSAYEYLELRFQSRFVRLIGSTLFILVTLLYLSIVMYAPALALSAVTGINLELLIFLSGAICTFYTALGGLKAVVWTDAFQAVVMYVGFLAIIIQGVIDIGGWKQLWVISTTKERLTTNFSPNPFNYMNFWSVVIGTALGWMSVYGTTQTAVQRYTSLSSLKKAQMSLLLVVPGVITMIPLVCLCGLVMFVYYSDCDPLQLKLVNGRDELLPYFTMEVLSNIKGLPGLFVSCIFSGTMSTVSSGLNSMAAVVWEDYLKPTYNQRWSDAKATKFNKIMAIIFGVLSVGLACMAKYLGGVFMAANTVLSAIGGPLSGLFLFGILFPWANKQGAIVGVAASIAIVSWICIGAQIYKPWTASLPTSIVGCSSSSLTAAGYFSINSTVVNETIWIWKNETVNLTETFARGDLDLYGINSIYKLSFVLYGLAAVLLVFIFGIPVSLATNKDGFSLSNLDNRLVWHAYSYICCCLPKSQINFLRRATLKRNHLNPEYSEVQLSEKSKNNCTQVSLDRTNIEINEIEQQSQFND